MAWRFAPAISAWHWYPWNCTYYYAISCYSLINNMTWHHVIAWRPYWVACMKLSYNAVHDDEQIGTDKPLFISKYCQTWSTLMAWYIDLPGTDSIICYSAPQTGTQKAEPVLQVSNIFNCKRPTLCMMPWKIRKNRNDVQLRCIATWGRPTSRQSFWALITRFIMHQPTNSTISQGIFQQSVSICLFWPNLFYACAETAIFELPVKVMKTPLDLVTQISYMVLIFGRSVDIYCVTLTFDPLALNICSLWVVMWSNYLQNFSEIE